MEKLIEFLNRISGTSFCKVGYNCSTSSIRRSNYACFQNNREVLYSHPQILLDNNCGHIYSVIGTTHPNKEIIDSSYQISEKQYITIQATSEIVTAKEVIFDRNAFPKMLNKDYIRLAETIIENPEFMFIVVYKDEQLVDSNLSRGDFLLKVMREKQASGVFSSFAELREFDGIIHIIDYKKGFELINAPFMLRNFEFLSQPEDVVLPDEVLKYVKDLNISGSTEVKKIYEERVFTNCLHDNKPRSSQKYNENLDICCENIPESE